MTTKLILGVQEQVIKEVKLHAENTGRSLSETIENCLQPLTENQKKHGKLVPRLKKLMAVVKLPGNFDEEAELDAYFKSKHL